MMIVIFNSKIRDLVIQHPGPHLGELKVGFGHPGPFFVKFVQASIEDIRLHGHA